jgi:hypothetical protein
MVEVVANFITRQFAPRRPQSTDGRELSGAWRASVEYRLAELGFGLRREIVLRGVPHVHGDLPGRVHLQSGVLWIDGRPPRGDAPLPAAARRQRARLDARGGGGTDRRPTPGAPPRPHRRERWTRGTRARPESFCVSTLGAPASIIVEAGALRVYGAPRCRPTAGCRGTSRP